MKDVDKLLKMLADSLKTMAKGVDTIADRVDALAKAQFSGTASPKSGAKPTPKARAQKTSKKTASSKVSASDTVYQIISRSKKGVDTGTIRQKTGFNDKKIHNAIYKLKNQGKIKSEKKGVYVKG